MKLKLDSGKHVLTASGTLAICEDNNVSCVGCLLPDNVSARLENVADGQSPTSQTCNLCDPDMNASHILGLDTFGTGASVQPAFTPDYGGRTKSNWCSYAKNSIQLASPTNNCQLNLHLFFLSFTNGDHALLLQAFSGLMLASEWVKFYASGDNSYCGPLTEEELTQTRFQNPASSPFGMCDFSSAATAYITI